jgi:hypothetical protein
LPRHDLLVCASFFGQVVEERFVQKGTPLQIGNSPAMGVPVPPGVPFIAKAKWVSATRVHVKDGRGIEYEVTPGSPLELPVGDVSLRMELVPRYRLSRLMVPSWQGVLGWFSVVWLFSVLVSQVDLVHAHRCDVGLAVVGQETTWRLLPECIPEPETSARMVPFTAEYLARLLKEDFDGERDGVIETEIDRPEEGRKIERANQVYLPAGAEGPITKMGGAEEVAVTPERDPNPVEERPAEEEEAEAAPLLNDDDGTPIEVLSVEAGEGDLDANSPREESEDGEDEGHEGPAEEEEGWGIPDWYDETDVRVESYEIQMMLKMAFRRLGIDPEDAFALSTLSYYQYLAMDYDAALVTYKRYIELFPDEPAGYNNKALIYKRRAKYVEEEALYRVALALDPEDVTALNNLAVCLSHQGRHDEALAIMAQLELLDPGDAYADLHRAKIHAEIGQVDLALDFLDRALAGMAALDTLHHIEFRQDIRVDPSFDELRETHAFKNLLWEYYGEDAPQIE